MLALTERLAFEHGLNWAFCDTDSMAFANTEKLPFDEFAGRVQEHLRLVRPAQPLRARSEEGPVSILEMEDQNFSTEKGKQEELEPLFCFAISAKRYALFNLDGDGQPIIRKASAHGLGHFVCALWRRGGSRDERGSGVRLWEEDVWKQIISAALGDRPARSITHSGAKCRPAHSRYGATRPAVLNWFKRYNEGRPYAEQVKPFNFLLTFFTRRQEDIATEDPTHELDPKLDEIRPVAPYEKDSEKALRRSSTAIQRTWILCRSNGCAPSPTSFATTTDSPNTSFSAAAGTRKACCDADTSSVDTIEDIGKESDGWEEDEARTEGQDTVLTYPSSSFDRDRMIAADQVGRKAGADARGTHRDADD